MKKARKIVIKPFKQAPSVPEGFEEKAWKSLEVSLLCLQNKSESAAVSLGWEELYGLVTDLCHQKKAAWLYELLQKHLAAYVERTLKSACEEHGILLMESAVFVERLVGIWEEYCSDLLMIRNLCLYLDRTYVIQTSNVASIYDMGVGCFQATIQTLPPLEAKVTSSFLQEVERERYGETVQRNHLKSLVRMATALHMYTKHVERPFLAASEVFYAQEGQQLLESASVGSFLLHVEKRLAEEHSRVTSVLDGNVITKKGIVQVVESQLLSPHVSLLIERGFDELASAKRVDDLHRMYDLWGRVNQLPLLRASWSKYIVLRGTSIVTDVSATSGDVDKGMVSALLSFKVDLDEMLESAFEMDQAFVHALKSAMEAAINAKAARPAELVAKFVDAKLKTGNKDGSDREVEALLDRVMILFRYIQGKDVFEAFYKKDLAKRLLLGRSASFDLEKSMIAKLKTECGSSFTNKLEGMFKDIDLSRGVMTQFQQHAPSRVALTQLVHKVDMHVHVLTTGFWPPYVPTEINLPQSLSPSKAIFESFYTSKFNGRQLQWQHSLGHCLVKANFPKGRKELAVSLFQALVLLCFNHGRDVIGFKDILGQTGIEIGELRRTLQSLACGKVRVLTKQPKGRDVADTDEFVFNASFSNQLMRIKINSIQMKETTEENTETHEAIFRERQYQVDAAIVRIMKSRKTLSHALLMSELFVQLKFPAKPVDIKRRIESLIDREYLERDKANAQVYNYLA
ncbi:hypothetical protein H257_02392 [Aphanomyces astaci]|uniref:Cullin family profile domain-containing protein n=1 Tax=Aphanomyces astaci TaxID=112090 RepID=W4H2K2_APHAT|nr:hypothetical protein H257_02392 [Aphanomyces astaci]ETV85831.1 hypothetical protein H257_02392 [Aphanomyces astaci]|eukprot:XP_009824303.1 hypothetical protein H257_02392 [Aphanomyces astaci]